MSQGMYVGQPTFLADKKINVSWRNNPTEACSCRSTTKVLQLPSKPTFSLAVSDGDRQALLSLGDMQSFAKGDFVFRAGAPGKHVYFLRKGRIKVYQPSHSGKEVILWFCFAGDMFGLAEVAQGGGRVVHAQACEDSEVLRLSQSQFFEFLRNHPDSSHLIMQVLSCRMCNLSEVIAHCGYNRTVN